MREIAENLPITEGVGRMMEVLRRSGYKTAILSGGFTYFGNISKQKFGFDYVYANGNSRWIPAENLRDATGDIVDGQRKKGSSGS